MWIRKSEIVQLSQQIQKAIEGQEVDTRDNKEGVLSILKNDIYTLIHKEKEQRSVLGEEKEKQAEFLADISHQLKTPITSLMLMTDLLEEAPKEKQGQFLFQMEKELAHMEWMVTTLLKIAKLDSGAVVFHLVQVNSEKLLQEVLKNLEILMDIKNQKVNIKNQITLTCDKKWTLEALSNLLKNALECSKENTTIQVECGENPIYQWISITDAGEGIPREKIPHLFRRFENSQNENGYGIGLPLALSIIRKQEGDIEVLPGGNGQGATFIVKFFK